MVAIRNNYKNVNTLRNTLKKKKMVVVVVGDNVNCGKVRNGNPER